MSDMRFSNYKGVHYFNTRKDAQVIADRVNGRVVEYTAGYAVQYWFSGPYYPEHTCRPIKET